MTHTHTNKTKIKQLKDASQRVHIIQCECGRSYTDQTGSYSHSLMTDMMEKLKLV